MCASLVSKIYHTFGKISTQKFCIFLDGAVPTPMFGGPLDLWVKDLWQYCLWLHYSVWLDTPITKPHLTFLSDVIPRLGLSACNAGPMCLQFGRKVSKSRARCLEFIKRSKTWCVFPRLSNSSAMCTFLKPKMCYPTSKCPLVSCFNSLRPSDAYMRR